MTSANLQQWISSPELLDRDTLYDLRTTLARYPYCQTMRLLYLKNLYLLHDASFGAELRKAALYVNDRRVLFNLIEGDNYVLQVSPDEDAEGTEKTPGSDRTLMLINTFLAQMPEEIPTATDIFEYTSDYTAYLLSEDLGRAGDLSEAPKLRRQELIDIFIEKTKEEPLKLASVEEETIPEGFPNMEDEGDSCFTETLAKIYIKQKRYSKALEIIKNLSLKNPKKNAYFADQIRFLEKLIINTKL